MKIYTKNGDQGETSINGKKVLKSDKLINCVGTLDELNAWLGFLIEKNIDNENKEVIKKIQDKIFLISAILALGKVKEKNNIKDSDIELLEKNIDEMEKDLQPLKNFILPRGDEDVVVCHIVRAVARRAERLLVNIKKEKKLDLEIKYINRLSDYLFVLARKIAKDKGIKEEKWTLS